MGNLASVKLEEVKDLEITEELVRDFQEKVRLVDMSMSGFAKSLDSMRISCEMLLRKIDKQEATKSGVAKEDKDMVQKVQQETTDEAELAVHLLRTIHESVLEQKTSALQALTNLLHYIIDIGKRNLDLLDEKQLDLSLEKYISKQKEDITEDSGLHYYETSIKDLRKELSIMSDLNKVYRDEIKVLNERESDSMKERDSLRIGNLQMEQDIKYLKAKIRELETNHHDISLANDSGQKINDLDQSMEILFKPGEKCTQGVPEKHLTSWTKTERWTSDDTESALEKSSVKIESLKSSKKSLEMKLEKIYSKECIHVQYIAVNIIKAPVADLIRKLKETVNTQTTELYTIKRKKKTELEPEIPVLVMCNTIHGPSHSAKEALENIQVSDKVALVLLHRNVTPTSISTSDSRILNKRYTTKLGGIFDILHTNSEDIVSCPLNDRNVAELAKYIHKTGVRVSKIETYGIC